MLRALTIWLIATLLGLPTGDGGGGSGRCSIVLAPGSRGSAEAILLARALADSVLAGPGDVEPSRYGGHAGAGDPGPIHGQIFEVERFGGADSARLAYAYGQRGEMRALIVPWDYDPACRPTRWSLPTVWVPPAGTGTFTVRLRPDSLWIDGLPVFDAFTAILEPYPLSEAYRSDRFARRIGPDRLPTDERLTPGQYFDLLTALRPREDIRERPDSAWAAFVRWQRNQPDLVQRYPANEIAASLARDVSRAKARRELHAIDPVIAGTYRMTASLDGAPRDPFYVRTRAEPIDEWHPRMRAPLPGPLEDPERPQAYSVLATGAPILEQLPADCRTAARRRQAYMYAIDPPADSAEPRREWRGWLEPNLVARQFPQDSAVARFARQAFQEWARRRRSTPELEAPARFHLDDDGMLRVEQTTRLADGRTLTVRGERISRVVEACER